MYLITVSHLNTSIDTHLLQNYLESEYIESFILDKNCEGLKKCKHEVKEVTLEEAKKIERRLCGFED